MATDKWFQVFIYPKNNFLTQRSLGLPSRPHERGEVTIIFAKIGIDLFLSRELRMHFLLLKSLCQISATNLTIFDWIT